MRQCQWPKGPTKIDFIAASLCSILKAPSKAQQGHCLLTVHDHQEAGINYWIFLVVRRINGHFWSLFPKMERGLSRFSSLPQNFRWAGQEE